MPRICRLFGWTVIAMAAGIAGPQAQGRGGSAWTTVGADAQRTASIRSDPKISVESMQKPGFQFLWKRQLDNQPVQLNGLTQPLLLPNIIAYKGFKALAFIGGSADNVYSIDYDLNRMFWQQHLSTASTVPGTAACPGGLTAITRQSPVAPATPGARGGGPAGAPSIAGGRGGGDNVFAISSSGMAHVMNPQIGTDQIPPVKFLPANARVVGSILIDTVLYAATAGNCGGAKNGVWAVDLASDAKTVTTWDSQGPDVVGAAAPTVGPDGTIYVATGQGSSPSANAVVSLESKTLTQKDWFSPGRSPFTAAPVVIPYQGKALVVAANKDGRLYVLDGASIGGADHKTPIYRTPQVAAGAANITGLATWQDAAGTRWVLAATAGALHPDTKFAMGNGAVANGALAAFSLVEQNGAPTLQPQWVSRDLTSPVTPAVLNGVVFAVSSGEFTGPAAKTAAQRAQRSTPAVLYALDGATGKQLWESGSTITSFVHGIGPSASDSQVYVVTYDGTVYAFGMPAER